MNILLLGPQGSGKGTQAKRLAATYGIAHISSGDLYREAIARGTDLGKQVEPLLASGTLVPDEITIPLMRDRLDRGNSLPGVVLDGYPRTLAQAEALDELFNELARSLDVVFELQVPDRTQLLERLLKRAAEENRTDDTPEAIQRRLETYDRETAPLVEYYRTSRGNVVGIHADRSIGEVFHEIQEALSAVEARA
ncbi:MAG TPA: adenylate kinase [Gaiellaceae bacterium]|nr:adenylate kinase [Gaiellaceae bacterium]